MIKTEDGIFVQTSYPDIRKYLFYLTGTTRFFTRDTAFEEFNAGAGADTA